VKGKRGSVAEAEAFQNYVALNDWQIEEIKRGVAEAERGDFASEQDVERMLTKWTSMKAR
jgi:RHH-type transcriptional regulator, rel operon repressor / antitoxin RelB